MYASFSLLTTGRKRLICYVKMLRFKGPLKATSFV